MGPSEARAAEAREWLSKADEDIGVARELIALGRFAAALFHCQQAAEKSLKGFLAWHDRPFPKTHDLERLAKDCSDKDATLGELAKEVDMLTDYAWKLRYPGAGYTPGSEEAEAMFSLASRVLKEIKSRLPL